MWCKVGVIASLMLVSMVTYADYDNRKCMDSAKTNLDMKRCSATAYQKAMSELDSIYNRLINSCKKSEGLNATVIFERLKQSQNSWIVYRDANCSLLASSMLGGSGESLIQSECLVEMTETRILELKKLENKSLKDGC